MKRLKKAKKYLGINRNISILFLVSIISLIGYSMWEPFVSKFYQALGAPIAAIGLLYSIWLGVKLFAQPIGGYLSDIYGRKLISVIFGFVDMIAVLIYFLSPNWMYLIPAVILTAIVEGITFPTFHSLLGDVSSKKRRATSLATFYLISSLPMIVMTPIGGLLVEKYGMLDGIRTILLIYLVTSFISNILFWVLFKERFTKVKRPKFSLKILNIKNFVKILPKSILNFLLIDSLLTFFASLCGIFGIFYAMDIIGVTAFEWTLLITIGSTFAILLLIPSGKLSDEIGRKKCILAGIALQPLGQILFVLSKNFWYLVVVWLIFGSSVITQVSINPFIIDHTKKRIRGRVFGLVGMLSSLASLPGPMIGAFLYSLSPQYPFFVSAIGTFFVFLIGIKLLK